MKTYQFIQANPRLGRSPSALEYQTVFERASEYPHKLTDSLGIWVAVGDDLVRVFDWLKRETTCAVDHDNLARTTQAVCIYYLRANTTGKIDQISETQLDRWCASGNYWDQTDGELKNIVAEHIPTFYMHIAYVNQQLALSKYHQCMLNSISTRPSQWNETFESTLGRVAPICFVAHHTHPTIVRTRAVTLENPQLNHFHGQSGDSHYYLYPDMEPIDGLRERIVEYRKFKVVGQSQSRRFTAKISKDQEGNLPAIP